MSISLVGGAPAVQFITAKVAGAAVTSGDWVQLSLDETTPDAFTCTTPDLTAIQEFFTVTGVVVGGTPGVTSFSVGTEVAICVQGPAIAKVEGTTDIAVNDPLKVANGTAYVVKAAPSVAVGTNAFVNSGDVPDANARSVAASSAVTNTTSADYDVTASIPANTLAVGDWIEIFAQGVATATNGTDTHQFTLKLGSTALLQSPALDIADNDVFVLNARVQVRAIGASGAIVAAGLGYLGTKGVVAGAADAPFGGYVGSTTVDTTGALNFKVTTDVSAASASNSSRLDILEVRVVRPTAGAETLANDLKDKANLQKLVKGIAMEAFTTNSTGYKKVWVTGLPR